MCIKKCNKCDKVLEKFGCFVPGKGPIEVPIDTPTYRATLMILKKRKSMVMTPTSILVRIVCLSLIVSLLLMKSALHLSHGNLIDFHSYRY